MVNFIFRNNPYTHPVLSEIAGEINFLKFRFLGLTLYSSFNSNSNILCIDDPLIIMLILSNHKYRKFEIVFYSLELFEKQVLNNSPYNFFRNIFFYATNYISQKKAKAVIFPSNLRLEYFNKRGFLKDKSHIIYNKPDFKQLGTGKIEFSTQVWLKEERIKGRNIVVFAGALASGRSIDKIIDNIDNASKISLLLAGKLRDEKLLSKINEAENVRFIGEVSRDDVFKLYEEADFGLLSYDNYPKNSEICAPIKIWEYHHFDLKIIGNNNKALLEEWSHLIDWYYSENDLKKLTKNIMDTSNYEDTSSMKDAFQKLIRDLSL